MEFYLIRVFSRPGVKPGAFFICFRTLAWTLFSSIPGFKSAALIGRFFYLIRGLISDAFLFHSGVQSSGVKIGWFSNRFGVSCSDKMIRERPILLGQFASRYKVRIYPSNRKRTLQLSNMTVQVPLSNAIFTALLYHPITPSSSKYRQHTAWAYSQTSSPTQPTPTHRPDPQHASTPMWYPDSCSNFPNTNSSP